MAVVVDVDDVVDVVAIVEVRQLYLRHSRLTPSTILVLQSNIFLFQ